MVFRRRIKQPCRIGFGEGERLSFAASDDGPPQLRNNEFAKKILTENKMGGGQAFLDRN